MSDKIYQRRDCRLYKLSESNSEYVKNCRMFNGELKTIVDTSKLNISMLKNAIPFFKDKKIVCNIHDGSPIRKPESRILEGLGKVKDLDNQLINGYDTFNSVMIDVEGHSIRLLSTFPYSNGEENFVSVSERYAYDHGQLKDKERYEKITEFDKNGTSFNQKDVIFNQLRNINTAIKNENPELTIIDIFDRGYDDVDLFELEEDLGNEFIVRAKGNRKSNEVEINSKGETKSIKLIKQRFFKGDEKMYAKISFRNKTYLQAKGIFEWNQLELNNKIYSVLRVSFYQNNGKKIFKEDMLLITSLFINDIQDAMMIWESYMQRTKIEGVFKFCKQELGWENPRMDNWTAMRNLLSFVYFIAGYFYEIEDTITNDPQAQWLAKLGNGKGKITPHFILNGLAKLIAYLEIQQLLDKGIINNEDIKNSINTYSKNL